MGKFLRVFFSCAIIGNLLVPPALAKTMLWESPLEDKVSWNRITYFGTILVGSSTSLASYNPETGEQMWKRDDLNKIAPFDAREMTGLPILILSLDRGLGGAKGQLEAISLVDGTTIWKTDTIMGSPLGAYAVPEKNLALFVLNMHGGQTPDDKPGIFVVAYNAEDGKELWRTYYQKNVNAIGTHLADNSGAFYVRMDLSGHQDPLVDGDRVYLPFAGVDCLDLATGKSLWQVPFRPAHKTYKKAYAPLIIEGDVLFATGGGIVHAIDKNTGEVKWQSKKVPSGLIAQLMVSDDMVLARLGGNFFNQGAKAFALDKPVGVVAFNRVTGETLWEFKGAKESITNLVHLPDLHTVMFADAHSLIGIDTQSTGVVKEAFKLPLEFKRSIGATDMASAGVKSLTGGIGGLIGAGAKLAVGKERRDIPVAVTKQSDGMLIVRGRQHLLAFDPAKKEIVWSTYFAAPGVSGFETLVMTSLTAFAVLGYNASYAAGQTSMSAASRNISQQFQRMDKFLDRRFSKSANSENYAFILTNAEEEKDKGVGIVAVNLKTGEADQQVVFDEKDPEYTVDEPSGRVYFFPKKKKVRAIELISGQ